MAMNRYLVKLDDKTRTHYLFFAVSAVSTEEAIGIALVDAKFDHQVSKENVQWIMVEKLAQAYDREVENFEPRMTLTWTKTPDSNLKPSA